MKNLNLNKPEMGKHRKLSGFGVFHRDLVRGDSLGSEMQKRLYQALIDVGFQQTVWQYVFEGQRGGLIYSSPDTGHNELHVRLYDDRVFAEYERARAYLAHFFGPRYNGLQLVRALLVDAGTDDQIVAYFDEYSTKGRLATQEKCQKPWISGASFPPISIGFGGVWLGQEFRVRFPVTWKNFFGVSLFTSMIVGGMTGTIIWGVVFSSIFLGLLISAPGEPV